MGNINISKYHFPKKIMRLCAIGMVANGKVDNKEKECITNIVVRDIINNCKFKELEQEFNKLTAELTPLYRNHCSKTNTDNTESEEYEWVAKKYLQKKYADKKRGEISDKRIKKTIEAAKTIAKKTYDAQKTAENAKKTTQKTAEDAKKITQKTAEEIAEEIAKDPKKTTVEEIAAEIVKEIAKDPKKTVEEIAEEIVKEIAKDPKKTVERIAAEKVKEIAADVQEIVDTINEYYIWARYYVKCIVNRLEGSNEQQGLFVDIGSYKKDDVKQELFDIILVILADNSILESERVAFMAIARIFRVRKVSLIWDELVNVEDKSQLFNGTFGIRIQQKEIIDADDVLMIQEAICNYEIQGVLKEGLKNATIAEKERYVKTVDQRNNHIFKWAVWGFILSAAFIYINISFLVEDKTIIRECLDGESPIENIYYNGTISAISEEDINRLGSLFYSDPYLIQALARQDVKKCAEYDKVAIKEAKKDITKWGLRNNTQIGDHKFLNELYVCLMGLFLWILFPFIRWMNLHMKEKIFRNREFIHSMFVYVLCAIVFLLSYENRNKILLSILHNPFWVLILMICIELMVFLRQVNVEKLEDEKKKNSTGLLVVIVVMAIVSDMCISFIELPVELKDGMLADKFAAALLLGCLCFFIGRFLNMYSLQERINISNMEVSIERIVKELKSSHCQKNS